MAAPFVCVGIGGVVLRARWCYGAGDGVLDRVCGFFVGKVCFFLTFGRVVGATCVFVEVFVVVGPLSFSTCKVFGPHCHTHTGNGRHIHFIRRGRVVGTFTTKLTPTGVFGVTRKFTLPMRVVQRVSNTQGVFTTRVGRFVGHICVTIVGGVVTHGRVYPHFGTGDIRNGAFHSRQRNHFSTVLGEFCVVLEGPHCGVRVCVVGSHLAYGHGDVGHLTRNIPPTSYHRRVVVRTLEVCTCSTSSHQFGHDGLFKNSNVKSTHLGNMFTRD